MACAVLTLTRMSDDKHLEALQGIWGEMKTLNGRVNTTNERIDTLSDRIDSGLAQVRVELRTGLAEVRAEVRSAVDQQRESEMHIATELVAVRGALVEVTDHLRAQRDEHKRLDALEERVEKLERKVG